MITRLRNSLRRLDADERGTTLTEVLVGMGLMAAFMAMFTAATLLISNSVNKVEAVTASSTQLNNAFLALDKSVRYASGISTPSNTTQAGAASDWHVEFDEQVSAGDLCVQVRLDGTNLQQSTWTPGSNGTGYSGLTAWRNLAQNLGNTSANPFALVKPVAGATVTSPFQRLTVTLTTLSGTNTSGPTQNSMTFTALNSDVTSTAPVCQQVDISVARPTS